MSDTTLLPFDFLTMDRTLSKLNDTNSYDIVFAWGKSICKDFFAIFSEESLSLY